LSVKFERNRPALEKNDKALAALNKLEAIYAKTRPYKDIREIEPLIEEVSSVNSQLLNEKRLHAISRIQLRIDHVTQQIQSACVPSEISNQALRPLQLAMQRVESLQGIAEIHQEISEAGHLEDDAYTVINKYIEQQQTLQKAADAKAKADSHASQNSATKKDDHTYPAHTVTEQRQAAEPLPKKIVTFETSSVLRNINPTGMIETTQDIEDYLGALRQQLTNLVDGNNKIRIK
jgi:hypothetical protein